MIPHLNAPPETPASEPHPRRPSSPGLDPERAGDKAGVSARTIHAVEKGRPCRQATKRRILNALGVPWELRERVLPRARSVRRVLRSKPRARRSRADFDAASARRDAAPPPGDLGARLGARERRSTPRSMKSLTILARAVPFARPAPRSARRFSTRRALASIRSSNSAQPLAQQRRRSRGIGGRASCSRLKIHQAESLLRLLAAARERRGNHAVEVDGQEDPRAGRPEGDPDRPRARRSPGSAATGSPSSSGTGSLWAQSVK